MGFDIIEINLVEKIKIRPWPPLPPWKTFKASPYWNLSHFSHVWFSLILSFFFHGTPPVYLTVPVGVLASDWLPPGLIMLCLLYTTGGVFCSLFRSLLLLLFPLRVLIDAVLLLPLLDPLLSREKSIVSWIPSLLLFLLVLLGIVTGSLSEVVSPMRVLRALIFPPVMLNWGRNGRKENVSRVLLEYHI